MTGAHSALLLPFLQTWTVRGCLPGSLTPGPRSAGEHRLIRFCRTDPRSMLTLNCTRRYFVVTKPQVLSWQCRWNWECAETGLLEESGACGLKDLPNGLLSRIVECLDLATQVSLWETDKHLCRTLNGQVKFVKNFESTSCSVPLDVRCHAEAFALCGIDLLLELPAVFDLSASRVKVTYKDGESISEMMDLQSRRSRRSFRVKYSRKDESKEIPYDEIDAEHAELLFDDLLDKLEVHKMLCKSPFNIRVQQVASRVFLESSRGSGIEQLCQCAQYCFELMCSRAWCKSVLYIAFPPPPPIQPKANGCMFLTLTML